MKPKLPQLPFITREMFAFDHGSTYELRVALQTDVAGTIALLGSSREAPFRYNMTPVADGSTEIFTFKVTDIPTFLTLFHATGSYEHGSCYAKLYLRINGTTRWMMAAGFMSAQQQLSWPMQVSKSPIPGRGRMRTILSADPAAGAEASITVPNGQIYKVNGVSVQIVTDATIANRFLQLIMTNPSGQRWVGINDTAVTASLTRNYTFSQIGGPSGTNQESEFLCNLPGNIWLDEASTIATSTIGIESGDNIGIMAVHVEQFWEAE